MIAAMDDEITPTSLVRTVSISKKAPQTASDGLWGV
jgi:hypothetical protein